MVCAIAVLAMRKLLGFASAGTPRQIGVAVGNGIGINVLRKCIPNGIFLLISLFMKKHLILLFGLCSFVTALSAELNNQSIIKMLGAGLSEDTILMAIGKEAAEYDVSVDGMIALKEAGVSEALIQAMMRKMDGGSAVDASGGDASSEPAVEQAREYGAASVSIAPPFIEPEPGNSYYARFTFFYERGRYLATNYKRGTPVSINTPIQLLGYGDDEMVIEVNGQVIKVKNISKYTGGGIREFASLMLADQPTPIESLGKSLAADIKMGNLRMGMTKEQALMAYGYPPKHETPSIEGDRWVYWTSRYVKRTVVFYDGVLSEGRGL
jgi:hypothetical protein